jgi:hypothetical protein
MISQTNRGFIEERKSERAERERPVSSARWCVLPRPELSENVGRTFGRNLCCTPSTAYAEKASMAHGQRKSSDELVL